MKTRDSCSEDIYNAVTGKKKKKEKPAHVEPRQGHSFLTLCLCSQIVLVSL